MNISTRVYYFDKASLKDPTMSQAASPKLVFPFHKSPSIILKEKIIVSSFDEKHVRYLLEDEHNRRV